MTAKFRAAVEAELYARRGYKDKLLTRLVCAIVDRAVKAERARWLRLDRARLDAIKEAEDALVRRMAAGSRTENP